MGPNDRAQNRKDDLRKASEQRRKLRDRTSGGGEVADWANAFSPTLSAFIAAVARDGGAVRFGYTRDGGAYAIGIYGDGEPYTVYVSPKEDINEWLRDSTEDFKS